MLGDADRVVEVADFGLVVPEHRQAAVAAYAVQAHLEHLAAAATGVEDGLPRVAQTIVARVMNRSELAQVVLVGQRPGDVVAERAAGPLRIRPASRKS